jgi:hypothetical protein
VFTNSVVSGTGSTGASASGCDPRGKGHGNAEACVRGGGGGRATGELAELQVV